MNATQYQMRRHPFLAGIVLLVLGPYLLAFALIFAALWLAAVLIDTALGNR